MAEKLVSIGRAGAVMLFIGAILMGGPAAFGQYTFVQDSDGTGTWDDPALWTGGTPGTFPNAPGATALFNAPVRSGGGAYTLTLPAGNTTVGEVTIDQSAYNNASNFNIPQNSSGSQLVFDSGTSDPAKFTVTQGLGTNQTGRVQVQTPVTLLTDLEISTDDQPYLNTAVTFTNRITGANSNLKIIKSGATATANLQFNDVGPLSPGEGFLGSYEINAGAIRFINTGGLYNSAGVVVNPNGQLQLGQNGTNVIPNWTMAPGATITLNGTGKTGGNNAEGALRFALNPATSTGATSSLDVPVILQTDATISVNPASSDNLNFPNIAILSQPVSGSGALVKGGAGTLVLSHASNSYSGDTQVNAGVLSITNAILADTADVYLPELATTGLLRLDYNGTDTIRSLFFNNVAQSTGTWGGIGSGADHETDLITGSGLLAVTLQPVAGLPGDYNEDDAVDAADYLIWRKNLGTTNPLPNDGGIGGEIGTAHYELWTANFGRPPGSGAVVAAAAVPEPSGAILSLLSMAAAGVFRRRWRAPATEPGDWSRRECLSRIR